VDDVVTSEKECEELRKHTSHAFLALLCLSQVARTTRKVGLNHAAVLCLRIQPLENKVDGASWSYRIGGGQERPCDDDDDESSS